MSLAPVGDADHVDKDRKTRGVDPPPEDPNVRESDGQKGTQEAAKASPFVPIVDDLDASDELNRASNFKPNTATSKESTVEDALARSRKKRDAKVHENRQTATRNEELQAAASNLLNDNFVTCYIPKNISVVHFQFEPPPLTDNEERGLSTRLRMNSLPKCTRLTRKEDNIFRTETIL